MVIGGLILAGGRSSRMEGGNKALLTLEGKRYIDRVAEAQTDFAERLLSVAPGSALTLEGYRAVEDIYPGTGPLGGLYSALTAAKSDALFVLPCDVPLIGRDMAAILMKAFSGAEDGAVISHGGRIEPLVGIYSKSCLPVIEEHIKAGNYRMMALIRALKIRLVELPEGYDEEKLRNVNTRADMPPET